VEANNSVYTTTQTPEGEFITATSCVRVPLPRRRLVSVGSNQPPAKENGMKKCEEAR
jgi:hypothetical protein